MPTTITFEEIHAVVARHAAQEAARNAPKASAIRAAYTLRSHLAELPDHERAEVLGLLLDELKVIESPTPEVAR